MFLWTWSLLFWLAWLFSKPLNSACLTSKFLGSKNPKSGPQILPIKLFPKPHLCYNKILLFTFVLTLPTSWMCLQIVKYLQRSLCPLGYGAFFVWMYCNPTRPLKMLLLSVVCYGSLFLIPIIPEHRHLSGKYSEVDLCLQLVALVDMITWLHLYVCIVIKLAALLMLSSWV